MKKKQKWGIVRTDVLRTVLLAREWDRKGVTKLLKECTKERKRLWDLGDK